ncbi:copper amine oxidase N-terminal domain-containing protein [Paenibacillus sp. LjRoot153]|uniref:copper amine oxidase N-terminal domain-containing protein n=1 Tax=Paenibacillus sp. LjRoot153 TaxID=3342270 RepID=UPI003ECFAAA9
MFASDSQASIRVLGKVIEVNGTILSLEVPPANLNGTILVPVRPIFNALGLNLEWDSINKTITGMKKNKEIKLQVDNTQAMVDGKPVILDIPPKIINGNTMVPLRFLGESSGANVEYTYYPHPNSTRTITDDEKTLRSTYNDALYTYNVEKENFEQVMKEYNTTVNNSSTNNPQEDIPNYYIIGDVISRDPFIVFGVTGSQNAPLNDPGFITTASNILITNPDSSKIMYNKYVQGIHYYKYTTTTVSRAGFTVPLYVFGDVPDSIKQERGIAEVEKQEKLDNALSIADEAEKRYSSANESLYSARTNLERYMTENYESKIKENPKSIELYVDYQSAVWEIGRILSLPIRSQIDDLFKRTIEVAKSTNSRQDLITAGTNLLNLVDTYNTQSMDWRVEYYKNVAEIDPYILLNHIESDNQKYYAAVALLKLQLKDKAAHLAKEIMNGNDKDLANKASSLLTEIDGPVELVSSIWELTEIESGYRAFRGELDLTLTFNKPITFPEEIDIWRLNKDRSKEIDVVSKIMNQTDQIARLNNIWTEAQVSTADDTKFSSFNEVYSSGVKSDSWKIKFNLDLDYLLRETDRIGVNIMDETNGIKIFVAEPTYKK